ARPSSSPRATSTASTSEAETASMTAIRCAAVDLGAASGRVVLAECDGERLALREALRFETPVGRDRESGYQCWDLDAIEARVLEGLPAATAISPLQRLGDDTWRVDYVRLDAGRRRADERVHGRDHHADVQQRGERLGRRAARRGRRLARSDGPRRRAGNDRRRGRRARRRRRSREGRRAGYP